MVRSSRPPRGAALDQSAAILAAEEIANVFPIRSSALPATVQFENRTDELKYLLSGIRDAIEALINVLDSCDPDADFETETDVGADDLGEPVEAA